MKNKPLIIAHRGYSSKYPENSLIAFEQAIVSGAQMIEFDVHLTKDQELIVAHDYKLGRTINGIGEIDLYTLKELEKLDCGSWFDPIFSKQKVPSLKEVFSLVKKRVWLNIELKHETLKNPSDYTVMAQNVLSLIADFDYRSMVVISSFDKTILKTLRSMDDSIFLGVLDHTPHIKLKSKLAEEIQAYSYHPHFVRLNQPMIQSLKDKNYKIFPYTVNSDEDFIHLKNLGVDGIITNEVEKLKECLNK